MSYVVKKVLETIHDYSYVVNDSKNRSRVCDRLKEITGHDIYFCEKYLNEINGVGVDLFNLQIDIDGNSISLFKYLNDYKLYDRTYKIKNIKKKLDDK